MRLERRVLDGDARTAAPGEHARDEPQRLSRAGAHDDLVGIGRDASHPRQVRGERLAQHARPVRVRVGQRAIGHLAHDVHRQPRPCSAREGREIRPAREEVELRRIAAQWPGAQRGQRRGAGDERARPSSADQIALARGGQTLAGGQPPAANGRAQSVLQPRESRARRCAVEVQQQFEAGSRIGTQRRHSIGP